MFRSALGRVALVCATAAISVTVGGYAVGQTTNTFPTSGNVGIGTTAPPILPLQVSGTPDGPTNTGSVQNGIVFVGGSGGNGLAVGILPEPPYTAWMQAGFQVPSASAWYPITLNPLGGNVGIGGGTTSPAYTLDVAGQIRSSTGGIVFPDGSTQTTAFNNGSGNYTITSTYIGGSTSVYNQIPNWGNGYFWQVGSGVGYGNLASILPSPWGGSSFVPGGSFNLYNSATTPAGQSITIQLNGATNANSYFNTGGNVGIGTTSPQALLDVNGGVRISGSGAGLTFPDGTVQATAYTGTCVATGGDYAESVDVSGQREDYEPGDVLIIGSDMHSDIQKSTEPYSTLVSGIYSTKPGYVGRRQQLSPKLATSEVPMAMIGIVPTKVSAENGPIHRGDLLVSASLPGYAMKGTDRSRMVGAVLGKAMGTLESGTGMVEVLVSLQ